MSIWSRIFGGGSMPSLPRIVREIQDILPMNIGPGFALTMPKTKQTPKQLAYSWESLSRPGYEKPIFNLTEIAQAAKTESYIGRSVDKHREHILRNGWSFVGKNPKSVAWIRRRMAELSESMGRPIEMEIRQAVRNMILYHNFFLSWTRDRDRPFQGRFRVNLGRATGLYSMNPTCMRFRRSEKNQILEWYQVVDGHEEESAKPVDVIHGAFDRDDGYVLGYPFILPVLDDILTWRRFEEIAEILAHKFAFPLYHHKIGDKDRDPEEYDDGSSEIGEAETVIKGKAPEGHLITSYRHSIEVIGAKGEALDIQPLIEYWERRVLAGLNLSEIDIGRGGTSNRNTAVTISKGLADRCGEYQRFFAEIFTYYILDELLLEGGYDLTPENRVFLYFPPIDQEAKRAESNHLLALYQGNAITHDELRIGMGEEPLTDEQWKKTYWEQIGKPSILLGKQAQMQARANSASNTSRPANQHGVKSTVTKVTKDNDLRSALLLDAPIEQRRERIRNILSEIATQALSDGLDRYNEEFGTSAYIGPSVQTRFMEDCVNPFLAERSPLVTGSPIQTSMLDMWAETIAEAGANYSYARMLQIDGGRGQVRWKLSDAACDECKKLRPMKIRRFTLGQMLPLHADCVLGLEAADPFGPEDFAEAEAELVRETGVDSLLNLNSLSDDNFCHNQTFPVLDEVSAYNALRILDSTTLIPVADKPSIRSKIVDRMSKLGFTEEEAARRVEDIKDGLMSDYDEPRDIEVIKAAVHDKIIVSNLDCSIRSALPERDFAGPNRTFPMHDAEWTRNSWVLSSTTSPFSGEVMRSLRHRLEARARRLGISLENTAKTS